MVKDVKILLFALMVMSFIFYFNCQPPATDSKGGDNTSKYTRWSGISHSNVTGNENTIYLNMYNNNTFSGSTTGADFKIDFNGGGDLSGPAFNINGTGSIMTVSSGSDTFIINFTGTISDSVMSGNWTVDYTTFPDDNGTFYLIKDGSSSSSSEPPAISSSSSSNYSQTTPYLNNISVTPSTLNGPGYVKVSVDVNDGGIGLQSLTISYFSPLYLSNHTGHYFDVSISDFTYNSASGLWEKYCEFKNYYETGSWVIYNIYLSNYLDNSIIYYINDTVNPDNYVYYKNSNYIDSGIPVSNTGVELTGTDPDVTEPVLNSILINPTTLGSSGGNVSIKLGIIETGSGITDLSLMFCSPSFFSDYFSGDAFYVVNFYYNSVSGLWEGSCNFQSSYESGVWKIDNISIFDNAENYISYHIESYNSPLYYMYHSNNSSGIQISTVPINSGSLTKN